MIFQNYNINLDNKNFEIKPDTILKIEPSINTFKPVTTVKMSVENPTLTSQQTNPVNLPYDTDDEARSPEADEVSSDNEVRSPKEANIFHSGEDENPKDLDMDLKEVSENLLSIETALFNYLAVEDLANCNYN